MLRCTRLHDRYYKSDFFFFSDFISLLTYFRGISEKSNKQYYFKFPDKYFFCCPYSGWGFSGAAHGSACKRVHLHKIRHTYPTMMKLCTVIPYLTKIQNIYKSRDIPIKLCWHQYFSPKSAAFIISRNTDIHCFSIQLLILLTFFWVYNGCFNKHGCSFDDVSKLGYFKRS